MCLRARFRAWRDDGVWDAEHKEDDRSDLDGGREVLSAIASTMIARMRSASVIFIFSFFQFDGVLV
jgi:hypothetical protein